MSKISALQALDPQRFETPVILKKLASSSRKLAELKGIAASIPNQAILINALGLQEAKDSSAIENIVTTHDELFKDDVLPDSFGTLIQQLTRTSVPGGSFTTGLSTARNVRSST